MKRLVLFLAFLLAPLALASPVGAAPAALCTGVPLAGVYHPTRLIVQNPCAYVTGTIAGRRVEADGDVHLLLALDAPFTGAINAKNSQYEHGDLVAEIIPADAAIVPMPALNARVMVVGPYVLDNDHGWMEIHPVRYIVPARTWSSECTPPSGGAARIGSC